MKPTPGTPSKHLFDEAAASSNKCLEGVPGVGFILVKNEVIQNAKGNSHSLSLDLYDQWQAMEKNKQWRFTPPTHVLANTCVGGVNRHCLFFSIACH